MDLDNFGVRTYAILACSLVLLAALEIGRYLIGRFRIHIEARLSRFPVHLAAGFSFLAWFDICVAIAAPQLARWVWLLLIPLALIGIVRFFRGIGIFLLQISEVGLRVATQDHFGSHCYAALFCLLLGAINLGPALARPDGWDELVYHVVLPKIWSENGYPNVYPHLVYSAFPSSAEILFSLVGQIDYVFIPRLISCVCWIASGAIVYDLMRCGLRPWIALCFSVAMFSNSCVLLIGQNCYVETLLLLIECSMLVLVRSQLSHSSLSTLFFIFLLAGSALSVKLTGASMLIIPAVLLVREVIRPVKDYLHAMRTVATSLAVPLVALPFYARAWLATGNPVHPFFAEHWTNNVSRIECSQYHHALGDAFGERSLPGVFVSPWIMPWIESLYDGSFGLQSICIYVILIASIFISKYRKMGKKLETPVELKYWAVFSMLMYLFWYMTTQQARFAIPWFVPLVLVSTICLRGFSIRWQRATCGILMTASFVSAPWPTTGYYCSTWLEAIGVVRSSENVNEGTGGDFLAAMQWINETNDVERTLLIFEHRALYLNKPHAIGTPFFQPEYCMPPEAFTASDAWSELMRRERFTHVLVSKHQRGPDRVELFADRMSLIYVGINAALVDGILKVRWESDRYWILESTSLP